MKFKVCRYPEIYRCFLVSKSHCKFISRLRWQSRGVAATRVMNEASFTALEQRAMAEHGSNWPCRQLIYSHKTVNYYLQLHAHPFHCTAAYCELNCRPLSWCISPHVEIDLSASRLTWRLFYSIPADVEIFLPSSLSDVETNMELVLPASWLPWRLSCQHRTWRGDCPACISRVPALAAV